MSSDALPTDFTFTGHRNHYIIRLCGLPPTRLLLFSESVTS